LDSMMAQALDVVEAVETGKIKVTMGTTMGTT
jgi:hypothetical protein